MDSYTITIDNFEGPMDLLLYFINRDKIDIKIDIKIRIEINIKKSTHRNQHREINIEKST